MNRNHRDISAVYEPNQRDGAGALNCILQVIEAMLDEEYTPEERSA